MAINPEVAREAELALPRQGQSCTQRLQMNLQSSSTSSASSTANSGGGLIVLGVDEESGSMVAGLNNYGECAAKLKSLCESAEPALFPTICSVSPADGTVLTATIPAG